MRLSDRLVVLLGLSLLAHIALLALLPGDGSLVEAVYARGIYPLIGPVVAFLPSLLPFSLAAVLVIVLVVWVPAYLLLNAWHWRRRRLSLGAALGRWLAACIVVGAMIFHAFYLFWGYNYLRPPLEQRLGLIGEERTAEFRRELALQLVTEAVAARIPVEPWDRAELDRLIDEAIARAVRDLEGRDTPVSSPLKDDLGTGFLGRQGNAGVVSPVTLEAHVDFDMPAFALPFTAAHEKAHLAGFARERDANFVAWYALMQADDPRLHYAGYIGIVRYFIGNATREAAAPLEPDLRALAEYRARNVSPSLQRTSQGVYRVYLQANRMPAGLGDYWQVRDLIEAWLQNGTVSAGGG